MKPLGQDSVQVAEVLNFFKVLQGTCLYPWVIYGTRLTRADLLDPYSVARNYMPDLGRLNRSQCTLGNCTLLINIFSPESSAQGEEQS